MSSDSRCDGDDSQTVHLHLQVLDQQRTITLNVAAGDGPIGDVLPVARQLSEQLTAIGIETAARDGRQVSCRAGCGACCRQLVAISLPEAMALADVVAAMPPERQVVVRRRFAEALDRLEANGLLEPKQPDRDRYLTQPTAAGRSVAAPLAQRYFRQGIACPFLEEESCSIYADRPLVCREYLVTSPAEDCDRLFETPVERVELPVRVGNVMVQLAHRVGGAPCETIPLVLALEFAEAHRDEFKELHRGLDLVAELVSETAAEQRRGS
ncbi:MAG TPA: YkgJ family cysteine cluster protein [Pirellulaceae bacterium]|jgi:Fe-S-cluster containining protein